MNTLDTALDSLSRAELSPAEVQDSQRKLDAVIAQAPRRPAKRRAAGWLAATASALATVAAFIWLPLTSTQALAFADVQKNFREFDTLRFEFEQRMDGKVLVKGRVSLLANGSVRTEVGDDVVVIVNSVEKRVLTLIESGRIAMVTPLDQAPSSDDSMKWLQEVRDFQGAAVAVPEGRTIRGQHAQGWRLTTGHGEIVLWANDAGLPLEMQIDQGAKIDMDFRFEMNVAVPADLFSTQVPAGYALQAPDRD
jgi:outer membrane lipoprotein-sorting protein